MADGDLPVIVTRPRELAGDLCGLLRAAGAQPIEFPVIDIQPLTPAAVSVRPDILLFVSRNAVRHGLPHVGHLLVTARVGAVGSGTAAALAAAGVTDALTPPAGAPAGGAGLLANPALAPEAISARRVLIVRGVGGSDELALGLRERGAAVEYLEVYRRVLARPDPATLARLRDEGREPVIIVTSSEGARNLFDIVGPALATWLRGLRFVVISPRVAQTIREQQVIVEPLLADAADDRSLAAAAVSAAAA